MKLKITTVVALWICFAIGIAEAKQPHLNREAAIQIAKKDLQTLKKPFPNGYHVSVENGRTFVESKPTRETYVVVFTVPHGGKRRVIYMVDIDKQSGKASSFTDYRNVMHLIP